MAVVVTAPSAADVAFVAVVAAEVAVTVTELL